MSDQNKNTEENNNSQEQPAMKMHVSPDLDYSFRDIANIYVGNGDVIFEFGNHHRAMPGNTTISNRIVLTTSVAHELQQQLQTVLMQAQQQQMQQMQQQMQKNKE